MRGVVVIEDPRAAAAALDPVRAKLLAELATEPASAAVVGERVGLTRQRANYHLRTLEEHGLVELAEIRMRGGIAERVLRATAASFVVSPAAIAASGARPEQVRDRLSAGYLVALGGRIVQEVGALAAAAEDVGKRLPTFSVDTAVSFRNAADRAAFADERWVDIRGALSAIRETPGLMMLILLAAFNNLLTGVFMALMDPYGLELVSVRTWGFMFGFMSLAFIGGGLVVARYGLGKTPVRIIVIANLVNWIMCSLFTLQASIIMLAIGMFIWMSLAPVLEAAEQTVLQRAIPFEKQGRVFGFAQLVENSASPITAFLMAPFAEAIVIPLMTDGRGADWIGGWFGTGVDRGIALIFTVAGLLGIVVTLAVRASKSYRLLIAAEQAAPAEALAA